MNYISPQGCDSSFYMAGALASGVPLPNSIGKHQCSIYGGV